MSAACDAILREDTADFGRMAIPLLHFRSAHPSALVGYDALKQNDGRGALTLRDRLAAVRDRLGTLKGVLPPAPSAPVDVLFVSHITSLAQARGARPDPYFGPLPQQLATAGFRCALAYIDQTRDTIAPSDWVDTVDQTDIRRILLRRRLDWRIEGDVASRLRATAHRLEDGTGHKTLRRLVARQARTGATRQGLRIAHQIRQLVRDLRPNALVFTYEGHAWERLAMAAARQEAPDVLCIAVHHAILAPLQHAITRRYGAAFDPDRILAAGQAAYDWLRSVPSLADRPMDILGSPKALGSDLAAPSGGRGSACLFLPEGFIDESLLLARAAIAVARKRPEVTCIVRLHPLVTKDALASRADELAEAPSNFSWSPPDRALSADTSNARWAVYRGSSAIVSAMADGVEPIYFGDEQPELRIDPLRGAGTFRKIAATMPELIGHLAAGEFDSAERSAAIAYAHDYYRPLDPSVLIRALPPPGASRSTEPTDDV